MTMVMFKNYFNEEPDLVPEPPVGRGVQTYVAHTAAPPAATTSTPQGLTEEEKRQRGIA